MRSFEILSHTADLRLRIFADSPEELFRTGLEGMASIIKKDTCAAEGKKIKRRIALSSVDRTSLLVDFLSEVLTLSQTKRAVFCDINFKRFTETELDAEISGFRVKEFDEDIKAVTYHEANVKKNKKGYWETVIIFDI
jgi:SHS2 domain-containing protein